MATRLDWRRRSAMTLLQPSFRGRLRLFFAVIVIVPMIAVGVVLFQLLDAGDDSQARLRARRRRRRSRRTCSEDRARGDGRGDARSQSDVELATAIDKRRRGEACSGGSRRSRSRPGREWIELKVERLGHVRDRHAAGDRGLAGGAAGRRASSRSGGSRSRSTTAQAYADEVARLTRSARASIAATTVLASTLARGARTCRCRTGRATNVKIARTRLPHDVLHAPRSRTGRRRSPCGCSRRCQPHGSDATILVVGLTSAFLALAFVFAVIVSRTLSEEVQRLLSAAQRLGRGDFSVSVPAEGNDEFAALGKEFNIDGAPARGAAGGPAHASAAGCRRRSAAWASRSRAAWTASACSRSSCRPRSTASAPPAGAPRCAAAPTRRWRRSPAPASPRPSTARCTPRRRP